MGEIKSGMPQNVFFAIKYLGDIFKKKREVFELRSHEIEPVHIGPGQTKRIDIGFRLEIKTGEQIVVYPSTALEASYLTIVRENTNKNGFGTSLLVKNTLEKQEGMGVQGFQPIKLGKHVQDGPGISGVYEINNGNLLGYAVYEKRNTHHPANRKYS